MEIVQPKLITGFKGMSYENRWRKLNIFRIKTIGVLNPKLKLI